MKVYYGGILISMSLYFIALSTKISDDAPFWKDWLVLFLIITTFGLGIKLTIDYIIDKLKVRLEKRNADKTQGNQGM